MSEEHDGQPIGVHAYECRKCGAGIDAMKADPVCKAPAVAVDDDALVEKAIAVITEPHDVDVATGIGRFDATERDTILRALERAQSLLASVRVKDQRACDFAAQFATINGDDLGGLTRNERDTIAAKIRRMAAALSDQQGGE